MFCNPWDHKRVGHDWATKQNWTDLRGIDFSGGGLVTKSYPTLVTSWTIVPRILSLCYFPGKNTGVLLPFPSPGDVSDPGVEPRSSALQPESLLTELWGNPFDSRTFHKYQNSQILRSLMKNDIVFAQNIYTPAHPPIYFKSSLDYL